jgi:hypothetical protein
VERTNDRTEKRDLVSEHCAESKAQFSASRQANTSPHARHAKALLILFTSSPGVRCGANVFVVVGEDVFPIRSVRISPARCSGANDPNASQASERRPPSSPFSTIENTGIEPTASPSQNTRKFIL